MTTPPLRVGLTGGIASGKSAVTDRLAAHGVPIIDADALARAVVAPGTAGLAAVVDAFGPGVLAADGSLDRRALRERVFADDAARRQLESILHPRIRSAMQAAVAAVTAPYCVLSIPLLAESRGGYAWLDHVVVVDVDPAVQVARLMRRDDIDETLARRMMAAQATRDERLAIADTVLANDGDLASLHAATDRLHERLLTLANAPTATPR
jgi:dephospho-CoA kinase